MGHQRKDITEGLEKFVTDAFRQGAISGREAESILHPLHHELSRCLLELKQMSLGMTGAIQKHRSDLANQMAAAHQAGPASQTAAARTHLPVPGAINLTPVVP